jgi:hypothetical protein
LSVALLNFEFSKTTWGIQLKLGVKWLNQEMDAN